MKGQGRIHGVTVPEAYDHLIGRIVPSQPLLLQTALDYLPPSPELVLELGCGTGILTGLLRAACPNCALTALDIDPEMLAIAAAKPELEGVRFIAGDLRDPWPGECSDVIITALCLHHVSLAERSEVAERAARLLRPGGRFICADIFRAEQEWEEELLTESWRRAMAREGAPGDVIEGMILQRANRMPHLSTVSWFQDRLREAGFSCVVVPFTAGFVALVVGIR